MKKAEKNRIVFKKKSQAQGSRKREQSLVFRIIINTVTVSVTNTASSFHCANTAV